MGGFLLPIFEVNMSKNLTFKLILEGDNKGLISAVKQSESVTKAVFDSIKQESEKLKQASEETSKEIGNIVPKGSNELADKLSTSLNAATGIIKDAGEGAKSAANNFTDFGNKAEKALNQLKGDLAEAKRNLEAFSKTNASPVDIANAQQQIDKLEKEVQQADQAFNNFHAEVGKANTSLNNTETAAQTAQKGIAGLRTGYTALISVMGGIGVGLGIKELAQVADSYTNLSARINIATSEGGNFTQAMAGVHQVALMTNSSLDATAGLFTKVNDVGKQMGMTQQQSLDLVKTINMAVQTGGGSAQASEAAIVQLTQALQSGVLRGDEFNSIMEQAPGISTALAKSLGVTTGELRKMAENGELSAEKVIKSLQSQSAAIEADYSKFPTTIGNALQRIQTQWQILIGTMDQANGSSATVAQWLVTLADNMGIVETLLNDVGSGFVWIGDQLSFIYLSVLESLKLALSSAYDAIKDVISTLVDFGKTVVDILGTSLTNALAMLSSFTGEATAAGEQVSFLERVLQGLSIAFGFVADGATAIKIGVNLLAGAFFDLASAANSVLAAVTWGDVSKQFAANADVMKNKAKQYYAEADKDAQTFQSKGMARLEEAAQTQEQKAEGRLALSKKELDQLLSDQQTERNGKKATEAEKLNAVQAYAEAAIKANSGVIDGVMQADLLTQGYIVTIDEAGKVTVQAGESAAQAAEKAKAKEEALKAAKENVKKADEELLAYQKQAATERVLLVKQIEEAKRTGDLNALASAQASVDAINAKENELKNNRDIRIAELNNATTGSGQVAASAYSRASAAAKLFGVDLDGSLNRVSKSFSNSGNELEGFKDRLSEAGIIGKQAGDVTYEAWLKWLETAKSEAEIDLAKQKLSEFGEQGKLSASQVEQGLIAVKLQAQELPDAIDPVTEAFKRLGIETKENLKLAAEQARMDYITIRDSGKATAEGIQKAYEKAAQAAATSGDAGVIASTNAVGAGRNLQIQTDATGRTIVSSMDQAEQSINRLSRSVGNAGGSFRGMAQDARNAADEIKNSIDARNDALSAKSEAQAKERAESKTSKATGGSFASYSRADVLAELKGMGYSDKEAQKLAGSIMSAAFAKDQDAMQKNMGTGNAAYLNAAFEKLLSQGQTASSGSAEVQKRLAALANGKGAVSVSTPTNSEPASTRRIELVGGGQTATVSGSSSDVDAMEKILSEFEMLKKSS